MTTLSKFLSMHRQNRTETYFRVGCADYSHLCGQLARPIDPDVYQAATTFASATNVGEKSVVLVPVTNGPWQPSAYHLGQMTAESAALAYFAGVTSVMNLFPVTNQPYTLPDADALESDWVSALSDWSDVWMTMCYTPARVEHEGHGRRKEAEHT